MVVPLVDLRHRRGERPQVLVEQVVRELSPVLGQRLGDLALLRGHQVAPDLPVGQRHRLDQRAVGVHGVTAAQEEVRPGLPHRLEDRHPAEVRGDPPALPDHVPGPDEPHVAPPVPARRGGQRPGQRLADQPVPLQALHPDPVVQPLGVRQTPQPDLAGEVTGRGQHRPTQLPRAPEVRPATHLDQHPTRPVGPGPDQRRVRGDVAALHTMGEHRAPRRAPGRRRVRPGTAQQAAASDSDPGHQAGPQQGTSIKLGHASSR